MVHSKEQQFAANMRLGRRGNSKSSERPILPVRQLWSLRYVEGEERELLADAPVEMVGPDRKDEILKVLLIVSPVTNDIDGVPEYSIPSSGHPFKCGLNIL